MFKILIFFNFSFRPQKSALARFLGLQRLPFDMEPKKQDKAGKYQRCKSTSSFFYLIIFSLELHSGQFHSNIWDYLRFWN